MTPAMRGREVAGRDGRYPERRQSATGVGDGTVHVDAAAGILDHDHAEALLAGVLGGIADAEIVGEAGDEDAVEAALAEIADEAGRGALVVLEESGVGVDVRVVALADDQLRVGDVEIAAELRSGRALDAVVRPQDLAAVGQLDRLVGLAAGIGRGEGVVPGGMPVLCQDDVAKASVPAG